MQKYNIKINKNIDSFLEKLGKYIFDQTKNFNISEKVIKNIYNKINSLEYLPYSNPKFNEKYRVMTIDKNYRVFYRINDNTRVIRINKIYSTSQNYNKYL